MERERCWKLKKKETTERLNKNAQKFGVQGKNGQSNEKKRKKNIMQEKMLE